jgi:hypothetical protein
MTFRVIDTAYGSACRVDSYDSRGPYLDYQMAREFADRYDVKFDADGIPMQRYNLDGIFHYSPLSIATYGLEQHAKAATTDNDEAQRAFLSVGAWLTRNQQPSGLWLEPFAMSFPDASYSRIGRAAFRRDLACRY